jgi:hypothetical protein
LPPDRPALRPAVIPQDLVCGLLRQERTTIRGVLSTMVVLLSSGRWRRPGALQTRLRYLLEFIHVFQDTRHRAKCDAVVRALAGRSTAVNRTLRSIDADRDHDARLLLSAHGRLAATERGEPGAADALRILLEHFHARTHRQLKWEDDVLMVEAAVRLDGRQWADLAAAFRASASGTGAWDGRCGLSAAPSTAALPGEA